MTTRKIIVGYDGSVDARAALHWAFDEAARTAAAVELVHAVEWPFYLAAVPMAPVFDGWPDEETERRLSALLHEAAAAVGAQRPDVPVRTVLLRGAAGPALADRSRQAVLLVVGTRGHGGFAGLLLGSVATTVAAHAHCPVVVVRAAAAQRPGDGRIVVGFDGSRCAELALAFAFERAVDRGAEVHVVRALIPPAPHWDVPHLDPGQLVAAENQLLTGQLAGWRQKHPTVPVSAEVVFDNPARALLAAGRDADLVVIGSRGRGSLRGLLLGSVGHQVLQHAAGVVAVVRELPDQADTGEPAPGS